MCSSHVVRLPDGSHPCVLLGEQYRRGTVQVWQRVRLCDQPDSDGIAVPAEQVEAVAAVDLDSGEVWTFTGAVASSDRYSGRRTASAF